MKPLTKYISHTKDLHSLNEYITEKLVINKDYKYDVDFYAYFKEDIDSLFKNKFFFGGHPSIELCLYPKSKWSGGLRRDIINIFNEYGNAKNPCYIGIAWHRSSNPVSKEACKIWEKFIKYIKDNKDELDLLICNDGFTCTYIINTDKALILLNGNTDIYYSDFADGYIIIQYK